MDKLESLKAQRNNLAKEIDAIEGEKIRLATERSAGAGKPDR